MLGDDGETGPADLRSPRADHHGILPPTLTRSPPRSRNSKSGGGTSHLNDAAISAVRMLSTRPRDHRRIVILIAETRDYGSETTMSSDVLTEAGFANVVIYPVEVSRLLASLTSQPDFPRPNPIPPEARQLPDGSDPELSPPKRRDKCGRHHPGYQEHLFKSDPIATSTRKPPAAVSTRT